MNLEKTSNHESMTSHNNILIYGASHSAKIQLEIIATYMLKTEESTKNKKNISLILQLERIKKTKQKFS